MIEETQRKNVGKQAYDLLNRPDHQQSLVDTAQEMLKAYEKELELAYERGLDMGYKDTFYVCVMRRRERTMVNVVRQMFYPRRTKPTPMFDMDCWEAKPGRELKYLWSLPDQDTYHSMLLAPSEFDASEQQLCHFCKLHSQGQL